ncbi:hypothetical protein, partial [Shimia sp.]|uniref:hypothetical protein n=1 Tax=Shimia sp. TaxID=1954381 RepID=UPI003B8B3BD4
LAQPADNPQSFLKLPSLKRRSVAVRPAVVRLSAAGEGVFSPGCGESQALFYRKMKKLHRLTIFFAKLPIFKGFERVVFYRIFGFGQTRPPHRWFTLRTTWL